MEEEKQAKEVKDNELDQLGTMKAGDYMIHFYLQNGKCFKLEDENESSDEDDAKKTFDAIVKIELNGDKKFS
jgi:hypothetical protein